MYSYIKSNEKGGKTAKGIKKNVIKNNMKHEDYKNVLLNNEQLHHKMKTIRSQKHQLGSYEINKVSLSCYNLFSGVELSMGSFFVIIASMTNATFTIVE